MLHPGNDRLDYGKLLKPPSAYELSFAAGTTYSLSLDALVGASLALEHGEDTESNFMSNPVCLLETLWSISEKMLLFCQSGQIHIPRVITPLYILLEKVVLPVKLQIRNGQKPSFHSKIWLIKYTNRQREAVYRFIILSRNLTFDRNWDVCFSMDGTIQREQAEANKPLADFLRFLEKCIPENQVDTGKREAFHALIEELPHVAFKPQEPEFYGFSFLPSGIYETDEQNGFLKAPLFTKPYCELLVMSPFLSKEVIREFNGRRNGSESKRPVLITRLQELQKLKKKDCSSFKLYTMKSDLADIVLDSEGDTSYGLERKEQDIHAKLYFHQTADSDDADLYLGSANASSRGKHVNVEFMLQLRSKKEILNLEELLKSLGSGSMNGAKSPFQEFKFVEKTTIEDETELLRNQLADEIQRLDYMQPRASAQEESGSWKVTVSFPDELEMKYNVSIRPLLTKRERPLEKQVSFENLTLLELSEFYVVSASSEGECVRRILVIPTEGLPENREKAVVTSVVSDEASFYRYVAFLLGDDALLEALEADGLEGKNAAGFAHSRHAVPALYEKMLNAAAGDRSKLRKLDDLMEKVSQDGVVPEKFQEMYNTFKEAVKPDV